MKTTTKHICFIFQVHQPYRLKTFHFFDIGSDKSYYDDKENAEILRKIAEESYLPTNKILMDLITTFGDLIKISFAISGTALDQMEAYAPKVLESFKQLSATGNVEFIGQTNSMSLSWLQSETSFLKEVALHHKKIQKHFGQKPATFLNTGFMYSQNLCNTIAEMGFKATIITDEVAVFNKKNQFTIYKCRSAKTQKLLLRNQSLSNDIAFRFSQKYWSEWPLTADKYITWIKGLQSAENVITLTMDYSTFGSHHQKETGIFDFLESLLGYLAQDKELILSTPQEIIAAHKSTFQPLLPNSYPDQEGSVLACLQNELQKEAFQLLYQLEDKVKQVNNRQLLKDWSNLQSADHFYYMCDNGFFNNYFNPYKSPYDAFLNYMNVLSDFSLRLENASKTIPASIALK